MENNKLLDLLNGFMKTGTIWEALDITITQATTDRVKATMPVSTKTTQQSGFLHGGASLALAESLATLGTALNIDPARQMCFGLGVTANHFRSRRGGTVYGEATILYKGRTTMVWDVKIIDEDSQPVSAVRCTVEIVDRPSAEPEQLEARLKAMRDWDSYMEIPKFW